MPAGTPAQPDTVVLFRPHLFPDFGFIMILRDMLSNDETPDLQTLQRLLITIPDPGEIEDLVRHLSAQMQGDERRRYIGNLLSGLLPLEELVPDCYAEWRTVVHDAVVIIGASLSDTRLIPKLVEQIRISPDVTLEKRLAAFISQMPSLQKLGQTIARNKHLNPEFRDELILLENMIRDVTPEQVTARIREMLGPSIEAYEVELESMIHAEASVCAVMRFSWINPANGKREEGVFKVLKPYVREFYREELDILEKLSDYLTEHRSGYHLRDVDFKTVFDDVRSLLEREIDSVSEQSNLESAYYRYKNIPGIRVPRLIRELSVPGITAMSLEQGVKVTDALPDDQWSRHRLAERIVEALIAVPLFSADEESEFHADPHAGNLFYDGKCEDLLIFDWAMTGKLNRNERRHIIFLVSAVMLRDEYLIYSTVRQMGRHPLSYSASAKIRDQVRRFTSGLSPLTVPGMEHVLSLLDRLVRTGISFSTPLLIFRKVLLTMDGILYDMNLRLPMENILTRYIFSQETGKFLNMDREVLSSHVPLSYFDMWSLWWSAQWLGPRIGMQTGERLFRPG